MSAASSSWVRRSTRDELLEAGRKIILGQGFSALTVREVAALAGANLGSFVYHFRTRDAYIEELIEAWYEPLFRLIRRAADRPAGALQRLRLAILELVDFGIEQERFMGRLVMAAAQGEPAARRFLRSVVRRHPFVLARLVREAQAEGSLIAEEPFQLILFLLSSVGLPRLIASAWQGPPLFDAEVTKGLSRLARDRDRIVQRLDWAIRGLAPPEGEGASLKGP